jgi:transmembrane sensor
MISSLPEELLLSSDPVRHEAAEWFVRLNTREPATDEVGDWQRWLMRSPAHRQAFAEIEDLWRTVGHTEDHFTKTAATLPSASVAAPSNRRRRWAVAAAATVLFGAVVSFLVSSGSIESNDLPSSAVVQTRTSEDRTYALPDGSRIQVGARTRIVVDFSNAVRSVIIDSGEAYFEVAHDPARPFVVHASGSTITAIGTAFNVHSALGRVSVAVVEGAVNVQNAAQEAPLPAAQRDVLQPPPSSEPVIIRAGEGVAYDRLTRSVDAIDTGVETSWRGGQLKFLREPLAYVIADIERYSDLRISIADPSVGEFLYTGTVIPQDVDDWLTLVSQAFPVEVQRINKRAILLKRRVTPLPVDPAA